MKKKLTHEQRVQMEVDVAKEVATPERWLELLDSPDRITGLIADLINIMDCAQRRVEQHPEEKAEVKTVHEATVFVVNYLCQIKQMVEDNDL